MRGNHILKDNLVSEWYDVNVGFRDRVVCVMSSCLVNVYMDGFVREVNSKLQER